MQGSKGNRLERWDLSDVGHKNAQKPTWQSGKCMNMWFYHVLSCLGLCNSTIFYTLISLTSGIVICGSVWLGHTHAFSLAELERRRWRGREREKWKKRPRWCLLVCTTHQLVRYMVTDRIMEKKNVQLRQAAPASDFSIIGFFPIRVQNIPEVIRTFFFSIILGGGHYFHNWFFLWNQGARADWPVFP